MINIQNVFRKEEVKTTSNGDALRAMGMSEEEVRLFDEVQEGLQSEGEKFQKFLTGKSKDKLKAVKEKEILELLNVEQSYYDQVNHYRQLGWLTTKDGKEGIVRKGNGKNRSDVFYELPTLEAIQEEILKKGELLKYKANQGFKRFILAPIGLSYVDMYNKLGSEYTRYQADPAFGLYRTDAAKTKYDQAVDTTWFSDTMKKEEDCYYYPETLQSGSDPKEHHGKMKDELLTTSKFPGWEIHILPESNILPRSGAGTIVGDRPELEANTVFSDYLEIIRGNKDRADGKNVYRGENGLIPEVWVTLAMQRLRQDKQILNDWYENEEDCAAVLIGMLTKSNTVPVSCFDADSGSRQVRLSGSIPTFQFFLNAVGSSVKVC